MPVYHRSLFLVSLIMIAFSPAKGQQIPLRPLSYRIFTPYVFNPAIVGSHDFSSIELNFAFQGESNAQLIGGNGRLTKKEPGYFSSPGIITFRNSGIGGYVFHENNPLFRNSGGGISYAYHIPLNRRSFSFLSLGAGLKGYVSSPADPEARDLIAEQGLLSNMDLGAYYYGKHLYAGVSATNIFGSPQDSASTVEYEIPVSQRTFLIAGYKLQLFRSNGIILEPAITGELGNRAYGTPDRKIQPLLKLYLQNFCLGAYFYDSDKNSFFFQYRYPWFYVGGFFVLPKESPYYSRDVIVEISAGINFSKDKSRHAHW